MTTSRNSRSVARRRPGAGRIGLSVVVLGCCAVVLGACGDSVRQSLGFGRTTPDEFAVVRRAPLSMPPTLELPPPRPGAPRPQEASAREQAAGTLFGQADRLVADQNGGTGAAASGEGALLAAAGANEAMPGIRGVVDRETRALVVADEQLTDALLFWRERSEPYSVVDAEKEAERLQRNRAEGRPVDAGQTPIINRTSRSTIEGLL